MSYELLVERGFFGEQNLILSLLRQLIYWKTSFMGKRVNKEKKNKGFLLSIFSAPPMEGSYCTPDVCFANTPQTFSSTSLIPPSSELFKHKVLEPSQEESTILTKFSSLVPTELFELIKQAAKQGFLISMLITLVNEGATDLLKKLNYHPSHIYFINQALRALLLIALGNSPSMALAVPVGSYVLSKYGKMSNEQANSLTTGLAVGAYLTFSENSIWSTSITLLTSVGTSLLGSRGAQLGYKYLSDTFFSRDEPIDNEEETVLSAATPQ